MKLLFLIPFLLFQNENLLLVKIKGLKSSNGNIKYAVYNSEDGFLKDEKKAVATGKVKVGNDPVIRLAQLKPGKYAITLFHDENDNNELDTNRMGIPKEGFGFSNNAMGMFGPPSFEKASFDYKGGNSVMEINLKDF